MSKEKHFRSPFGAGRPEIASAAGWPVALYFHRVTPNAQRYTEITPTAFAVALDLLLEVFEPLNPSFIESWSVDNFTSRPVFVITLDDGYADNWDWAIPALEERGLRAIFFVVTDAVGSKESPGRMSWSHLAELKRRGHLIGSHTATHRPLHNLPSDIIAEELERAFASIEGGVGKAAPVFAYPFGRLPRDLPSVPSNLIAFGTVRAPALPWTEAKQNIRRTYLPTHRPDDWKAIVRGWRKGWYAR